MAIPDSFWSIAVTICRGEIATPQTGGTRADAKRPAAQSRGDAAIPQTLVRPPPSSRHPSDCFFTHDVAVVSPFVLIMSCTKPGIQPLNRMSTEYSTRVTVGETAVTRQ